LHNWINHGHTIDDGKNPIVYNLEQLLIEVAELYAKKVAKEAIRLAREKTTGEKLCQDEDSFCTFPSCNCSAAKYTEEEILNELFKQPKA